MAKKIRGVKLKEENIQKNSGKNISHTISKIKANERYYTTQLVIVFMIAIIIGLYFGLRVSSKNIYIENMEEKSTGFSYTSRLVFLNNKTIGNNTDNNSLYTITLSNMTESVINYLIRIVPDEDQIQKCNCKDTIVPYNRIKYSLEDKIERSFNDEDMIITTGYIHPLEREDIPLKIWLSDELDGSQNSNFYGKIILEKIEQNK